MNEWQIRTEEIDGTEGCECFDNEPEARTRYAEMRLECADDPDNTIEHIELLQVLEQDECAIGENKSFP